RRRRRLAASGPEPSQPRYAAGLSLHAPPPPTACHVYKLTICNLCHTSQLQRDPSFFFKGPGMSQRDGEGGHCAPHHHPRRPSHMTGTTSTFRPAETRKRVVK